MSSSPETQPSDSAVPRCTHASAMTRGAPPGPRQITSGSPSRSAGTGRSPTSLANATGCQHARCAARSANTPGDVMLPPRAGRPAGRGDNILGTGPGIGPVVGRRRPRRRRPAEGCGCQPHPFGEIKGISPNECALPGHRGRLPRAGTPSTPPAPAGPDWRYNPGIRRGAQEGAVLVQAASTHFWLASGVRLPSLADLPPVKVPSRLQIPVGRADFRLQPMMWMFLAILATFLVTRTVTRLIRSGNGRRIGLGNVSMGGNHVHHQVFGILIIIGTGIFLISATPHGAPLSAAAGVFGLGVGLTVDEFALWLHLEDVY